MEVSRGDGSLGTVLAVQGGLALRTLALFGSAEQQARWLVPVARGEVPAAFALTEPDHGSDSVSLETVAARGRRRVGAQRRQEVDRQRRLGRHHVRVGARDDAEDEFHGAVRCFLVEQDTPGYTGTVITGKASLRGIHQAHIALDDVRVPARCGAARARRASRMPRPCCTRRARVSRGRRSATRPPATRRRSPTRSSAMQFGKPLAKFQMVQERLAQMLEELTAMQLYCRAPGRPRASAADCVRPRPRSRSTTTPAPPAGSRRPRATCSAATASCSRTA